MSSARSPDLRVELRADARVAGALLLWLAVVMAALWQADLPAAVLSLATVVLLGLGLPVVSSQRFGTGKRPTAVHWQADGTWRCTWANGSGEEMELSGESRGFPGGALLVFRGMRSRVWALLLQPWRHPDRSLRRLCARLGLEPRRSRG